MLNPCTQLGEHIVGNVGGQLRAEKHPDTLGADQFDGLLNLREECFGRVGEQQVCLVEEEHQLRLVDVADLGQIGEQIGQHPHQERREHHRPGGLIAEFKECDDSAALGVDAQQVGRFDLRLTEEGIAAFGLEVDQRAKDHPGGLRGHPTDRLQLHLALVTGQVGDH